MQDLYYFEEFYGLCFSSKELLHIFLGIKAREFCEKELKLYKSELTKREEEQFCNKKRKHQEDCNDFEEFMFDRADIARLRALYIRAKFSNTIDDWLSVYDEITVNTYVWESTLPSRDTMITSRLVKCQEDLDTFIAKKIFE